MHTKTANMDWRPVCCFEREKQILVCQRQWLLCYELSVMDVTSPFLNHSPTLPWHAADQPVRTFAGPDCSIPPTQPWWGQPGCLKLAVFPLLTSLLWIWNLICLTFWLEFISASKIVKTEPTMRDTLHFDGGLSHQKKKKKKKQQQKDPNWNRISKQVMGALLWHLAGNWRGLPKPPTKRDIGQG